MVVRTETISLETHGHGDVRDITPAVSDVIRQQRFTAGTATVFSPSSTSALTTIEFESGCVEDLRRYFDEVANPNRDYAHNARWGDGNGHSHLRAALLRPSLTIPVVKGRMTLGTWQQIVFVDFDNRPRQRELIVQMVGEADSGTVERMGKP